MKLHQALHCLALAVWVTASTASHAQPNTAAPPPAAPPQRTAAELEKLLAPIALYPDPLIATILPASVYPLEIVQAARFVQDTNKLAKLDEQPWDENVRAVARVSDAIKKLVRPVPALRPAGTVVRQDLEAGRVRTGEIRKRDEGRGARRADPRPALPLFVNHAGA